jgi:hypothetical protein
MLLIAITGCGQTVEHFVYAGIARPADANGAVKIATNSKVLVTVEGDTTFSTSLDLGGWYAIPAGDLTTLVKYAQLYQQEHPSGGK